MELRHLRYFVATAEERSFVQAARRLRVAQPAISKQVRDLEDELGVALLERLPRGVRLTSAGEGFLVQARITLAAAERAMASVRCAGRVQDLKFAHGEMAAYNRSIEGLLAAFRSAHSETRVVASSRSDWETHGALLAHEIDVAAVFLAQWPVKGVEGIRLIDCTTSGVLLPASHPLAANPAVRLKELRALTWLHSSAQRWPGFFQIFQEALRDRGLVPLQHRERSKESPSGNMPIASGESWALASEAIAAPYRATSTGIVYRPFVDPPIPCWIALVWLPPASPAVSQLVAVAQQLKLTVD